MGRYRKKPVVIEAILVKPPWKEVRLFCPSSTMVFEANMRTVAWLVIPTLEGEMRANPGDWIIRGVKGEFYPCKPDIFDATYEKEGVECPTE